MNKTKIAVIGAGYWGKNLIRTFNHLGVLSMIVDIDSDTLEKYSSDLMYSNVIFSNNYEDCLNHQDIDGVVIATPPITHYPIAKFFLLNNKHVFVEKPMTLDPNNGEEIVNLAEKQNLVLMVGHIFLYSSEIIKLKEIISSPDFGDIRYAYIKRLNLGKIQNCGVIMDLAPHDVSILDYLFDDACTKVSTVAQDHVLPGVEDVAFITLNYGKGFLAQLHLSWIDPLKVRDIVVVGTKQMAVCDSNTKSINIYNNNVALDNIRAIGSRSYGSHLLTYKYGDVITPYIEHSEPMINEASEFIECIQSGEEPIANGKVGVGVVKTVDKIKESLYKGGLWQVM